MEINTGAEHRAGRREWIGLAVLALPTLLLALDLSVLYLALPSLSKDLGAGAVEQLWITDIYGFMTAGFLVTMGTLGDRIGRRKLLLIGAVVFGAASTLAAFAGSPATLIIARAVMGVAGATLMPSTLALISNMFRDPRQRGVGIAVWMSCFMGGAAIGPVVGGLLLVRFWWGSVFLLGIPVMLVLLAIGPALLPEYRDTHAGRLDLVSVALSLAAILPVVYGFKEIARDPGVVPILVLLFGAAIGVVFVLRQRSLESPLLDVRLFGNRAFSAALVVLMFGVAAQGGVMLLVTQQLQLVQGLSPLSAGLWLVPSSLAMVAGSLLAPLVARRIRPGIAVAGGMLLAAAGFVVLALLSATSGLSPLVIGVVAIFLGVGVMGALTQDLVVGSVPPEKAGSAASLSQTSGDFGIAFGVAALGSIGTAVYSAQMDEGVLTGVTPDVAATARESIAGAIAAAGNLPSNLAGPLLVSARNAFTVGLNIAAIAGAVVVVGLAVLSAIALRRVPPTTKLDAPVSEPVATG